MAENNTSSQAVENEQPELSEKEIQRKQSILNELYNDMTSSEEEDSAEEEKTEDQPAANQAESSTTSASEESPS